MTSKEALEKLKSMPTCSECELYGSCFGKPLCNELYNTIKQDLDRLEKLEKAIEILKELFFIDLIERENDYKLGFEPKEPIINQPRFSVVNLNKEIYNLLKEVLEKC